MPWKLSEDMKRFRELTMGNPVIMGRKTFESIGKPLDGRYNIVLTSNENIGRMFLSLGCDAIAGSMEGAFTLAELAAEQMDSEEIFVIGGESVYRAALNSEGLPRTKVDKLYITVVYGDFDGDAFFHVEDMLSEGEKLTLRMSSYQLADEKNSHTQAFLVFDKSMPKH